MPSLPPETPRSYTTATTAFVIAFRLDSTLAHRPSPFLTPPPHLHLHLHPTLRATNRTPPWDSTSPTLPSQHPPSLALPICSLSTLQFAERATAIRTSPHVNVSLEFKRLRPGGTALGTTLVAPIAVPVPTSVTSMFQAAQRRHVPARPTARATLPPSTSLHAHPALFRWVAHGVSASHPPPPDTHTHTHPFAGSALPR